MNPLQDKAIEVLKEAGWSYDPDKACFTSPDGVISMDLLSVMQCLAETDETVLKQFLNDAKGFGRLSVEGEDS